MRLIIWSSDGLARLFQKADGRDTQLTNTFHRGRKWTRIVIEQRIGANGWSRVYLDDQLVAEGEGKVDSLPLSPTSRYGIVAIDSVTCRTTSSSIQFKRVRLYRLRLIRKRSLAPNLQFADHIMVALAPLPLR